MKTWLSQKIEALEPSATEEVDNLVKRMKQSGVTDIISCLLYTSPSPRDLSTSRMPSSA